MSPPCAPGHFQHDGDGVGAEPATCAWAVLPLITKCGACLRNLSTR